MYENFKINDVVKLNSGINALIVGSKTRPYFSQPFRTNYFPKEGFDYIILYQIGKHSEEKFEGRENIRKEQILEFIKHLDFEK